MSANRGLAALLKPSVSDTFIGAEVADGSEAENRMSLVNSTHTYEAVHSPAAVLQRQLQAQFGGEHDTAEIRKYPPALTITGTVLFCAACWYGVFQVFF